MTSASIGFVRAGGGSGRFDALAGLVVGLSLRSGLIRLVAGLVEALNWSRPGWVRLASRLAPFSFQDDGLHGYRQARARRWDRVHRPGVRGSWGSRRRGRLQHEHDGLSGDPDRPVVSRPDRRDDLPDDRQLRGQRRGRRERPPLGPGVRRPRVEPRGQQPPVGRDPRRLPRRAWRRRHRGDRHAGPGPPDPAPRCLEGDRLLDRPRRREPRRQGGRQPGPAGTRPDPRGDAARCPDLGAGVRRRPGPRPLRRSGSAGRMSSRSTSG